MWYSMYYETRSFLPSGSGSVNHYRNRVNHDTESSPNSHSIRFGRKNTLAETDPPLSLSGFFISQKLKVIY